MNQSQALADVDCCVLEANRTVITSFSSTGRKEG